MKTKVLSKVLGVTGYFCDIEFVTKLFINGVQREEFPRYIHWLLADLRDAKPDTLLRKKQQKEMSLLMLNIGNMYNCVDEVYGLRRGLTCVILPDEFKSDFEGVIKYLPERFVSEKKFHCECSWINHADIYFIITKIRPQAISYLKQDDKEFGWKERIIKLLELMGKRYDDKVDFNKYIDDWTKRLLEESIILENENPKPKRL